MLDAENEVRTTLPGHAEGRNRRWITDLDTQTLKRAESLHCATDEEKGPWIDEQCNLIDMEKLMMGPDRSHTAVAV